LTEASMKEDKNINRRNFLKKIAMTAVFAVPTIQSFQLLAQGHGPTEWTAHGHGHHHPPPAPPPPHQ
jgi:hypothetical protein